MSRYALLVLPAANRVYADAAVALTRAELEVFGQSVLGGRVTDVTETVIGGVPYVTFAADGLGDRDVAFLSNLSSVYALFEAAGPLLRPVELSRLDQLDEDLLTIPKYSGKTNEHFTKLLLNVTLMASDAAGHMLDRRLAVLDPLCGRGTTLSQALVYGYDAAGVDVDQRDVEAYATFVQTWLRRKRLKHRVEWGPVRRDGRQVTPRRLHVELAPTKERYQAGDTTALTVLAADTVRSREFFRPGTFDVVVTDAPYGVQHGSRTSQQGLRRDPLDLLAGAAPVWAELLRAGGAMGIAWNTRVAPRQAAVDVLAGIGLDVVDSGPYRSLAHRVDQTIQRDVVVARRPGPG